MKKKLVRDKIPGIIEDHGKVPLFYRATGPEARELTIEKMYEEVSEFAEDPCLEEAADIYHAFMALIRTHDMSFDEVIQAAVDKASRRGRFNELYVLEGVVDAAG